MPTQPGRPRSLNYRKKLQLRDLVAGGASLAEAAVAVGVSVRTVQREARWDSQFDQELRSAQSAPADPQQLMQRAARTHWRAAAWLLEREDPERYGRRPASSCSPKQFQQSLFSMIEAALEFAPPELRSELFDHLEQACEAAFAAVFPQIDPWGNRRQRELPPTPLATLEKTLQLCQGRRQRHVADYSHEEEPPRVEESLRDSTPHVAEPLRRSRSHVEEPLRGSKSISEKSTHVNKSLRDLHPDAQSAAPADRNPPSSEKDTRVLSPKTRSASEPPRQMSAQLPDAAPRHRGRPTSGNPTPRSNHAPTGRYPETQTPAGSAGSAAHC